MRQYTAIDVGDLKLVGEYGSTDTFAKLYIWKGPNDEAQRPPQTLVMTIDELSYVMFSISNMNMNDFPGIVDKAIEVLHRLPEGYNPLIEKARI